MKIAYLTNTRFPSERAHSAQIANMCQAFSRYSNQMDLVANKRVDLIKSEIDLHVGFKTNFNVIRVNPKKVGLKYKYSYALSELHFLISCFSIIRKNRYDLIFSRHEWILWLLSFVYPKHKLMWESHEAKLNFASKNLMKKKIKVVVISRGILDEYLKLNIDPNTVIVADDGIDESFFADLESKKQSRDRNGLFHDKQIAMYIGGFGEGKGIDVFCEAASMASEINFVAIGGKDTELEIFKNKYPAVNFLGYKPYKELRHNQQSADVLVIPNSGELSISSLYTSPLKLFAHMSSGVPLVCSDVPSLVGVTGRDLVSVFKPDNPGSLAETLKRVIAEKDVSIEKALRLKEVSKKYLWTERARDIISFYKLEQ